jgi:hypothetical protein
MPDTTQVVDEVRHPFYTNTYPMYIWQWLETDRDLRDDFIVQAPKVESLMGISGSISIRLMSEAQMK